MMNEENNKIIDSNIEDSQISDSKVEDSVIEDSVVKDVHIENSKIEDTRLIGRSTSDEIIEKRKEKIGEFIKNKTNWIFYIILGLIVFIAVRIRTRSVSKLKDVATGTWTLGPDLDPFLFLRWAEYIVEHGKLMAIDTMRYVPFDYNNAGELKLLSYMIAWFYKLLAIFSKEITVTYAAIIFPVVMFALTVIAFFFLVRKIFWTSFKDKIYPNIIALIACIFLSIIPSLLPRTIAGIPEKESAAFFFLFVAFYFFICAWQSKKFKEQILFALLSGISTICMALIWGGYTYIFLTLGLAVLVMFLIGQVNLRKFYVYSIWLFSSLILIDIATTRYNPKALLTSTNTSLAIIVFMVILIYFIIYKTNLKRYFDYKILNKFPPQAIAFVLGSILLFLLVIISFGPSFILEKLDSVFHTLIKPAVSRLIQTVAENKQPYFNEWSGNFGPNIRGIPLYFWLFFVGSIYLFKEAIKKLKIGEKIFLTGGYILFLMAIIFSRYSSESLLNGENFWSLVVYFGGIVLFLLISIYYYLKIHREKRWEIFKSLNFEKVLLLCFFILGVVSARGAVRLIMVLVPSTSAIVAFFIISPLEKIIKRIKIKREKISSPIYRILELGSLIIVLIIIFVSLYSGLYFYKTSMDQASYYHPTQYNWQWQKAMGWVRDNTPENAVFGHWWDYGYWIQSIGKRATVLDGGNAISYWNHLMGREVLTTPDDKTALEFLYSHDVTHYLIDSTDLGKYQAYSKIGSDINYDRISYFMTFFMDEKQVMNSDTGQLFVYSGGFPLEENVVWETEEGTKTFIKENSVIGGVLIEQQGEELIQPVAAFFENGNQVNVPLKYLYYDHELHEYENGIDAGIFLVDQLSENNEGIKKIKNGAGIYLSKRTVHSFFVRKYLFEEEGNFKLVHSEPNYVVEAIRAQGEEVNDIIYFGSQFFGPIKIWEIEYPDNIEINQEYLSRDYPEELKYD